MQPERTRTVEMDSNLFDLSRLAARISSGELIPSTNQGKQLAEGLLASEVKAAAQGEIMRELGSDRDEGWRQHSHAIETLAEADLLVSKAHNIIWAAYDEWEGENGRREALNTVFWKLHDLIRPTLTPSNDPNGALS